MKKEKAPRQPPAKPTFLNVDLEIASPGRLDGLVAAWGEEVFVLYHGPGSLGTPKERSSWRLLTLETARQHRSPDDAIHALCALVETLSPIDRRCWERARKRFDLGYRQRPGQPSLHFALRPDTLARVAQLGVELAVSVYRYGG